MSALSSYTYFASRMALVSLIPGLAYWLFEDFWTGLSVFLVFLAVSQLSALWVYRKDIGEALRRKR